MKVLLRLLGVELVSRLAQRLPGPLAWWASLVVLVVVNLLPVWAVLTDRAGIGDVFLVYWIENVVVWATGTVRIATAEGAPGAGETPATFSVNGGPPRRLGSAGSAAFFALHYGIFTFVHGVFTLVIVLLTGLTGGAAPVLVLAGAITAGHLVQLGVNWFGRGERLVVSPGQAMFAPYPRMIALHVAIIGGFFFLGGPSQDGVGGLGEQTGVAILCGLKTLLDVAFHLRRRAVPAVPPGGDGLYGAPAPQPRT